MQKLESIDWNAETNLGLTMKLDFISWRRQTECCLFDRLADLTRRAGRSIRDSKASRSVPWRSPCWAVTVGRKMLSPSGRAIVAPETDVLLSGGELPSCVSGSHVNQSFVDSRRSLCGISADFWTLGFQWDLDEHIKEGASYNVPSVGIGQKRHPKCGKTVIHDSWKRD